MRFFLFHAIGSFIVSFKLKVHLFAYNFWIGCFINTSFLFWGGGSREAKELFFLLGFLFDNQIIIIIVIITCSMKSLSSLTPRKKKDGGVI